MYVTADRRGVAAPSVQVRQAGHLLHLLDGHYCLAGPGAELVCRGPGLMLHWETEGARLGSARKEEVECCVLY